MQAKGFANWPNATDSYEFSALPAGIYTGSLFSEAGSSAFFWSATENNGNSAYAYYWVLSASGAYLNYGSSKNYGFSVRCIKDEE